MGEAWPVLHILRGTDGLLPRVVDGQTEHRPYRVRTAFGPTAVISRVEILQRSSLLPYEVCYPFSGKTRGACSACPDSGNSGLAERLARAEDRVIYDGLRPMSLLRWRRADIARDFTRAKHALGRMSWLMMKACADAMS